LDICLEDVVVGEAPTARGAQRYTLRPTRTSGLSLKHR
jgi:hypothetical protein